MRRTHIMHKRDNRRAHYYKQIDPTDARPVLAWEKQGMADKPLCYIQVMTLDGAPVARVEPVGDCDPDWGHPNGFRQRHDAIILAGPRAGERKAFPDDSDSARQFCEAAFA